MWLVGGIYGYGYNVLVWLVGVVVRRYIDILTIIINFPYSTCIRSFLAAASLLLCSFLKCFFGLTIIESVDSISIDSRTYGSTIYAISRDERGFPLTQYITNGEYLTLGKLSRILNTTIVFYG